MIEFKTLKAKVEHVLEERPHTRNSDIDLTIEIWKRFYPEILEQRFENGRIAHYLPLYNLGDVPREDNVKRIRAKIQNEEKRFIPTSQEVALKRGFEEVEWRRALGYPIFDQTGQGQLI